MIMYDSNTPEWIRGNGPEADIIISTRARLARSLASFPFPSRASGEDLNMIAQLVRRASAGLLDRFPKLMTLNIGKLSEEQKNFLLDARIMSLEHMEGRDGQIIIMEPTATFSIMINEEDHLRLQAVMSGLACQESWELVDWADDVLSAGLDYGFSEKYGYLTANVSNVGTGLRVSVMIHLAGLAMLNQARNNLRAAYDLGVSIRGLYGEGTRPVGDLFQISNEITLGLSESDITSRVRSVATYLLDEERKARKELFDNQRNRLIDAAERALGILQNARSLRPGQAISMISPVRLAASMGLVSDCNDQTFNELMLGMQVGSIDNIELDMKRAALVRAKISKCESKIRLARVL